MRHPKPTICPICGAPIRDNPPLTMHGVPVAAPVMRCAYAPVGVDAKGQREGRPQWAWDLEHRVNRLAGRLAALEGAPLEGDG